MGLISRLPPQTRNVRHRRLLFGKIAALSRGNVKRKSYFKTCHGAVKTARTVFSLPLTLMCACVFFSLRMFDRRKGLRAFKSKHEKLCLSVTRVHHARRDWVATKRAFRGFFMHSEQWRRLERLSPVIMRRVNRRCVK